MTQAVRFALCGTGFIARLHAGAIASTEGAELAAVHNHRPESLAAFTADHPVGLATTDWRELVHAVEAGQVDVAIVGTPNTLHADQAVALMEAGAHVLVEKPMAVSVAEAERMVEAAGRTGRALLTGHMWRFDPDARWLRGQVASGALGRVIRTRSLGVHTWWGPSGWFAQRSLAGGGALADMGIHAIDTTRYLLGDPQPVRVTARIGTYYGTYDVDDTAVLLVDWEDGTTSQVEAGWWQVQSDGPEAATRLHGTRAFGSLFPTLVTRELEDETVEQRTPPPFERTDHCDPRLYAGQVAHAAAVARGETAPENGPDVGLTAVRIMEAAYRSAETGQEVGLG
jgi:predicted dehydrogenase